MFYSDKRHLNVFNSDVSVGEKAKCQGGLGRELVRNSNTEWKKLCSYFYFKLSTNGPADRLPVLTSFYVLYIVFPLGLVLI